MIFALTRPWKWGKGAGIGVLSKSYYDNTNPFLFHLLKNISRGNDDQSEVVSVPIKATITAAAALSSNKKKLKHAESILLSKNYIAEKIMLEERSKIPQDEEPHRKKKLVDHQTNLIYVKIGNTEHPAFELLDDAAPAATAQGSDSVWVKWASNGKKECVFKHQIVREDGPQARKRKQPDYYHNQHST